MAILETSTVHGAAKLIGLSQTGVTQRIRSLEQSLGVTLFTRSRKGMLLTTEGRALAQYCHRALELEGETLAQLDTEQRTQDISVSLSAPSSIMRSRIIPGTSKVLEQFPNLAMEFNICDDNSGANALKSGKSQLSIILRHEVVSEFDSKLLKPEEYLLVGPSKWKKRDLKELVQNERVIDFNQEDDFTINYLKKFKLYKYMSKSRHFVNNTDALTSLIIEGQGFSVLSKKFAEPFLKSGSIVDLNQAKSLSVDFALAWYPRAQMPTYLKKLIQAIK
jgi:DNA-binding transcriptional LysR family regulator